MLWSQYISARMGWPCSRTLTESLLIRSVVKVTKVAESCATKHDKPNVKASQAGSDLHQLWEISNMPLYCQCYSILPPLCFPFCLPPTAHSTEYCILGSLLETRHALPVDHQRQSNELKYALCGLSSKGYI